MYLFRAKPNSVLFEQLRTLRLYRNPEFQLGGL